MIVSSTTMTIGEDVVKGKIKSCCGDKRNRLGKKSRNMYQV